jgi:citronellol/citronellal dehydrogenase
MGLEGKRMIMSGGSRGIGLAIARRAARDGAKIALLAKTAEPDPRLEGTIYTAAKAIEEAGGTALPIVGDVRDEDSVKAAVAKTVAEFGGIDICVNNASAINLAKSTELEMKRYDLMQTINTRGTFVLSRECAPHLREGDNPHVLTLSPPLDMKPEWFGMHLAYTLSKYGMSMCTLGMANEFAEDGIAVNSLWPRTIIATDAVRNILGGEEAIRRSRKPAIMADAAYAIFNRDARSTTGNFFIDDDVLAEAGITDLSPYQDGDGSELQMDIFIAEEEGAAR